MTRQGEGQQKVVLDSGRLRLEFRRTDGGLALAGLRPAGGREWLSDWSPDCALWRLTLRDPAGATVELTSTQADCTGLEEDAGQLRATWSVDLGQPRAQAVVNVSLPAGSALSQWSFSVRLPRDWAVAAADFPVLPNIEPSPGLKLAAPAGWGLEYGVSPGTVYQGAYPSCLACMPFMAFCRDGGVLYVAAHDPDGSHKRLNACCSERAVSCTVTHWPAVAQTEDGTFRLSYEMVVGAFPGGWYEAAQVYREFSLQTRWGGAGPFSQRLIPEWVRDTDLWLRLITESEIDLDACIRAREFFDVPVAVHWYRWHRIPYDTLYPEYFPAKPGFAEGVRKLQQAGLRVMPYINGRLCDPESETWKAGGSRWAARTENGEPYAEVYGSKVPLNVMCPGTARWRDKVAGLVERLLHECGVDGVYIDQIGAAAPERCFDPAHEHLPGSGRFWVDGYRRLLDDLRPRLPEGRALTTEENAECWIDQFDGLLVVNTPTASGCRVIPLFPAVYSGRARVFGFQYTPARESFDSLGFRAKMARAFLWGSQLGWVDVGRLMSPKGATAAAFLRRLARCRRSAHAHLAYGRFLGEVPVHGDNPVLTEEAAASFGDGTYELSIPAVPACAWLAEDGSLGVALVNVSDAPRQVSFELPLVRAGLDGATDLEIEVWGPDGRLPTGQTSGVAQSMEIESLSARMVVARQAGQSG